LLTTISALERTGVLDTADMRELAEGFEVRRPRSPEDEDLARYHHALARVRTIR
jgi:hypothetical protein